MEPPVSDGCCCAGIEMVGSGRSPGCHGRTTGGPRPAFCGRGVVPVDDGADNGTGSDRPYGSHSRTGDVGTCAAGLRDASTN